MNPEEIRQFEELLRAMPLRRPPERLDRRVARIERGHRVRRRYVAAGLAATALAAAAVLVVMLLPPSGDQRPDHARPRGPDVAPSELPALAIADPTFSPDKTEYVWSSVYAGEVVVHEGKAHQRVRHQTVRHVQWSDDRLNVRIEWTIPREEVFVPLEYY